MNPIKVRILYSLISILVAWCMAWTAGGTFSAGAGGGGGTTCSGTYGETANGSWNTPTNPGFTWVIRTDFDCTAAAEATKFNIRLNNVNQDTEEVVYLIYADNGSGTDPGALIWQSDPHYYSGHSEATVETDTVDEALSGTYLWIGFHLENKSSAYYYTANSPARNTRIIYNAGTFPDVDTNWDTTNDSTSDYGFNCYLSY